MGTLLIGIVAVASCATTDATDISGTYEGNATYTISPATGSVGALATRVDIADNGGAAQVTLAPDCVLDGTPIEQLSFPDNTGKTRFAFTSESIDASQSCTLAAGLAFSVVAGELTVDHGLILALDVGGTVTAGPDAGGIAG